MRIKILFLNLTVKPIMLKLALSFLMIPLHAASSISVLCGITCFFLSGGNMIHGTKSSSHITRAVVYFCISSGLLTALVSSVYGVILMFLGFILKSWRRAIISGCTAAFSIFLWRYFLTLPYFFK